MQCIKCNAQILQTKTQTSLIFHIMGMDNSTKPPRNVDNNFTEYHSSHQFKDITTESFSDTTSSGIISSSTESYRYIECQLFSGMTWMCDVLIATKRTACISSMAVALLTMLLIVLFKKYRDSFQRMILNLALAAVCYSFAMCIADIAHQPTTICKVQGTLLTLFGWNCCLWIVAIMLNMYFMIVLSIYMKQYEKLLTVFCWGFPCLVAGIPLLRDMFVPAGAWCLVRNDLTWRFGILCHKHQIITIQCQFGIHSINSTNCMLPDLVLVCS